MQVIKKRSKVFSQFGQQGIVVLSRVPVRPDEGGVSCCDASGRRKVEDCDNM